MARTNPGCRGPDGYSERPGRRRSEIDAPIQQAEPRRRLSVEVGLVLGKRAVPIQASGLRHARLREAHGLPLGMMGGPRMAEPVGVLPEGGRMGRRLDEAAVVFGDARPPTPMIQPIARSEGAATRPR